MKMPEKFLIKTVLENTTFTHPVWYCILALIFTILIRLVLTYFKAKAIKNGEIDELWEEEKNKWSTKDKGVIFWHSFKSNGNDFRVDDYWLPVLIGLPELLIYPILMANGLWAAIVAWIVIKTASSWGGWHKTRTAYNRFLFGNILSLFFSTLIYFSCIK